MESQDLNKLAAAVIRQLQTENNELRQQLAFKKEAEELVFEMYKLGAVSASDLEDKLHDLETKSHEERQIIKQATLLTRSESHPFRLGSEEYNGLPINAEERFFSALINNPED